MAQPSLPDDIEASLAALRRDVDRLWSRIVDEQDTLLNRWYYISTPVRVSRLRQMERTVTDVSALVETAVRERLNVVNAAYETGAWNTALAAGTHATFNLPDIDAMASVALDTMEDVLAATQHMRADAKALTRTLTRDWISAKLVTGKTAEDAGIDLALALRDQRISAIVYADGRRVGLTTYTDMVMRTKTAQAYQEGGFQQGRTLGIEWWEIMDGPDCGLSFHDDPTLADGLIVDTTTAERWPISHPNCVRVTTPRPDVHNAREATRAEPTPEQDQREDQARASRAREAANARQPRRVGLDRQAASRARRATQDLALRSEGISAAQERFNRRIQE